jgi:hypothetical protein
MAKNITFITPQKVAKIVRTAGWKVKVSFEKIYPLAESTATLTISWPTKK